MRRRFLRASIPSVSIFFSALAVALVAIACSKSKSEPTADAAPPGLSQTVAVASIDAAPAPAPAASEINPALPITNRLVIESQNRPAIHPKAEEVFAAFTKAGVTMKPPTQHLASTYAAKYCASEKSPDETILLGVCEFANEADATAGRDLNEKMFKAMENRTVYRNKSSTLAIVEVVKNAGNDATVKKLVAAFQSL